MRPVRRPLGRLALAATVGALGALTFGASAAVALPDNRTYEMVSPGDVEENVMPAVRAASDGDAVGFQYLRPDAVKDVRGPLTAYTSRRGAKGWEPRRVTPTGIADERSWNYVVPQRATFNFSDDLSKGLVTGRPATGKSVVPGEPDVFNLYRVDPAAGVTDLLTPFTPPPVGTQAYVPAAPRVAWASGDLEHVLFDSESSAASPSKGAQYFPGGPDHGVYTWSKDQGMSLASILPNGRFAESASAGSGPADPILPEYAGRPYSSAAGSNTGAMSEDGKRIFFTDGPSNGAGANGRLYVRKNHGERGAKTVEIGTPADGQAPPVGSRASRFLLARKDGRRALLTSCARLTADSTAVGSGSCLNFNFNSESPYGLGSDRPELYVYDEDANGGTGAVVDVTTGDPTGAGVLGVLGANDQLTRVYFAASGVLAPGGTQNKPNLYVWDQNDGITFIAQLRVRSSGTWGIPGDYDLWTGAVNSPKKNAYVTSSGGDLVFSTHAKIDPEFNNIDPEDGYDPLRQVYSYHYGQGQPTCVSCKGKGPNSTEGTVAPQRMSSIEFSVPAMSAWQKRSITEDGSQVFFESADKLVATDKNTTTDVYVYNTQTKAVDLISSGRSGAPSNFAGASADGGNVYFRTNEGISAGDVNGAADLYTARRPRGAVIPDKPAPIVPCQGAVCIPTPPSVIIAPPSNLPGVPDFDIAEIGKSERVAFGKTGRMTMKVTTPGAGAISITATGTVGTPIKKRKGSKAKTKYKNAKVVVAQVTANAPGPGEHQLTLVLTKAAKAQLKRTGRLPIVIEVRYGALRQEIERTLTQTLPKKKTTKKSTKKKSVKRSTPKKGSAAKSKSSSSASARATTSVPSQGATR